MITSHIITPLWPPGHFRGPKWNDMQSIHACKRQPVSRGRVSALVTGNPIKPHKIARGGAAAPEPAWENPGVGLAPAYCQGWRATSASSTQPPRNQHPRWQRRHTGKTMKTPTEGGYKAQAIPGALATLELVCLGVHPQGLALCAAVWDERHHLLRGMLEKGRERHLPPETTPHAALGPPPAPHTETQCGVRRPPRRGSTAGTCEPPCQACFISLSPPVASAPPYATGPAEPGPAYSRPSGGMPPAHRMPPIRGRRWKGAGL